MKNCIECNHNFTTLERIKGSLTLRGHLKCPECNSVYKPEVTFVKFIYVFITVMFAIELSDYIAPNSLLLECIISGFTAFVAFLVYYAIPHRWNLYKKIN